MKIRLLIVAFVLVLCIAPQLKADTYQVTYVQTSGEGCSISCFGFPPGLLGSFTATFALPAANILSDGSYDVSSSYALGFASEPPAPTANAIVAGGVLTDLTVAYLANFPPALPLTGTETLEFDASGGTFFQETDIPGSCGVGCAIFFSTTFKGTYTIADISGTVTAPEPPTLLLLGLGFGAFLLVRKRLALE